MNSLPKGIKLVLDNFVLFAVASGVSSTSRTGNRVCRKLTNHVPSLKSTEAAPLFSSLSRSGSGRIISPLQTKKPHLQVKAGKFVDDQMMLDFLNPQIHPCTQRGPQSP